MMRRYIFSTILTAMRKNLTIMRKSSHSNEYFSHSSENSLMFVLPYKFSISLSHIVELASLGILQSPRGLIEILPTLGPSGKQERLNC